MENTEKKVPFIKTLQIWNSINSSVTVDCGDGTTVNIEVPWETTKDLDLDQKYAILKAKADRYIKCIEKEIC